MTRRWDKSVLVRVFIIGVRCDVGGADAVTLWDARIKECLRTRSVQCYRHRLSVVPGPVQVSLWGFVGEGGVVQFSRLRTTALADAVRVCQSLAADWTAARCPVPCGLSYSAPTPPLKTNQQQKHKTFNT
jgi:hypothetical protein